MNRDEATERADNARNAQIGLTAALTENAEFIEQQQAEAQKLGAGLRGYVHASGVVTIVEADDVEPGELVWHPDIVVAPDTRPTFPTA